MESSLVSPAPPPPAASDEEGSRDEILEIEPVPLGRERVSVQQVGALTRSGPGK